MTKVTVRCGNVSVEAESQKQLFEELAAYQEVFGTTHCGDKKCGSTNLRYTVRVEADAKGKEHKYFEVRCQDCFAKLPFGQHQNGKTLFPKKWLRWNPETKQEVEL